jgi:hypothetical protein
MESKHGNDWSRSAFFIHGGNAAGVLAKDTFNSTDTTWLYLTKASELTFIFRDIAPGAFHLNTKLAIHTQNVRRLDDVYVEDT